jgi:hypothetical protein
MRGRPPFPWKGTKEEKKADVAAAREEKRILDALDDQERMEQAVARQEKRARYEEERQRNLAAKLAEAVSSDVADLPEAVRQAIPQSPAPVK